MAGASLVLTDGSLLSKLDQRLYRIERILCLISGLAVFSLVILAVISVAGRNFFNQPLPGYVDWIEQAMPLIAFLGISYTQRDGGHIRMDMFVGALKGRALNLVEFATTFAALVLIGLLIWGSWSHFGRSFDFGAPLWSRDSSMDIAIPLWPAKLLVPVAFSILALRLTIQLVSYGGAFLRNDSKPVAVPLILDAAEVAAMETELLASAADEDQR